MRVEGIVAIRVRVMTMRDDLGHYSRVSPPESPDVIFTGSNISTTLREVKTLIEARSVQRRYHD